MNIIREDKIVIAFATLLLRATSKSSLYQQQSTGIFTIPRSNLSLKVKVQPLKSLSTQKRNLVRKSHALFRLIAQIVISIASLPFKFLTLPGEYSWRKAIKSPFRCPLKILFVIPPTPPTTTPSSDTTN
jgi:hypothetical protein